jgi:hypothetical protein
MCHHHQLILYLFIYLPALWLLTLIFFRFASKNEGIINVETPIKLVIIYSQEQTTKEGIRMKGRSKTYSGALHSPIQGVVCHKFSYLYFKLS